MGTRLTQLVSGTYPLDTGSGGPGKQPGNEVQLQFANSFRFVFGNRFQNHQFGPLIFGKSPSNRNVSKMEHENDNGVLVARGMCSRRGSLRGRSADLWARALHDRGRHAEHVPKPGLEPGLEKVEISWNQTLEP
jgi:hypothetical protein